MKSFSDMNIKEHIEKMKIIQRDLLEFVEKESNTEENYENFIKIINDHKIIEDQHKFQSVLRLISQIGNEHRRVYDFIYKIERILEHFKKDITKHFSNSEIFKIFENNKRILLFLIQEKVIIIDEYVVSRITSNKYYEKDYPEYFAPEIKDFLTDEFIMKYSNQNKCLKNEDFINKIKKEIPEDFYNKRKEGENDSFLCSLIRKDDGKEFGVYINRHNLSFDSTIEESIFETNPLLMNKKNIELIEYASFFGSNEIIKYIEINGEVELTSSIWRFAIHSENAELIKYLEDKNISPPLNDYETILRESIKCHHNDVANYIIYNLISEEDLQNNIENKYYNNLYRYAVEYDNYCFFPENIKNKNLFFYLCLFNYYTLVKIYLEEGNIDINSQNI